MRGDESHVVYPERFIMFQDRIHMNANDDWKEDKTLQENFILLGENLDEVNHIKWIRDVLYIRGKPVFTYGQISKRVDKFYIFYLTNCNICGDEVYWRTFHKDTGHHRHAKWISQVLETDMRTDCLELVISGFSNEVIKGQHLKIQNKDPDLNEITIQLYNSTQEPIIINQVYIDREYLGNSILSSTNKECTRLYADLEATTVWETLEPDCVSNHSMTLAFDAKPFSSNYSIFALVQTNGLNYVTELKFSLYNIHGQEHFSTDIHDKFSPEWKHKRFTEIEETLNDADYLERYPTIDSEISRALFRAEESEKNKHIKLPFNREVKALKELLSRETNEDNYEEKFFYITLLEHHHKLQSQIYTNAVVKKVDNDKVCLRVQLINSDKLGVKNRDRLLMKLDDSPEKTFTGFVKHLDTDYMEVALAENTEDIQMDARCRISTTVRNQPTLISFSNLALIKKDDNLKQALFRYLFPTEFKEPIQQQVVQVEGLNEQQNSALNKMLNMQPSSPPFLLSGPAGSGKSKVLVEFITIEASQGKSILVTAPTNGAVNDLFAKLKSHDPLNKFNILKLSSSVALVEKTCETFCSLNEDNTSHIYPQAEAILNANIIICTLQCSVRMSNLRVSSGPTSKVFQTLVVDEAAYPLDITLATPLITNIRNGQSDFKVILAGDDCQLSFVPRSVLAQNARLQNTMTRLSEREVYRQHCGLYEMLNLNYRCPKAVVVLVNKLVYKGRLVANSQETGLLRAVHIDSSFDEVTDPSAHSIPEALESIKQAFELRHKYGGSVVVICFYKNMCSVIKTLAKRLNCFFIKVSTGETIQGAECDHVIMTTCVRTVPSPWHESYERMNVMVSRTKQTVTVIGNLSRLSKLGPFQVYLKKTLETGEVIASLPNKIRRNIAVNIRY